MTHCVHCGQVLGDHRHVLECRIEVLNASGESLHLTVLGADSVMSFCGAECWVPHQRQVMAQLKIIECFPVFGVVSTCCRCGSPVDRRVAYVAYPIMDMVMNKQPWLTTCNVQAEEEFAVLCQQCAPAQFESEEEVRDRADLING